MLELVLISSLIHTLHNPNLSLRTINLVKDITSPPLFGLSATSRSHLFGPRGSNYIEMVEPKDQPIANSTALENECDTDKGTSENQAVVNVVSTCNPLGLLDLPPEVRLMIFRHVLVRHQEIDVSFLARRVKPEPCLSMLETNRLIHREAFGVYWRENLFINFLGRMHHSLEYFPQIADTIQHIRVTEVNLAFPYAEVQNFRQFRSYMANPSITRGSFTVHFTLDGVGSDGFVPLRWFIRALGRFTNFRIINLHVWYRYISVHDFTFEVLECLKIALEPVFGSAIDHSSQGDGLLRF